MPPKKRPKKGEESESDDSGSEYAPSVSEEEQEEYDDDSPGSASKPKKILVVDASDSDEVSLYMRLYKDAPFRMRKMMKAAEKDGSPVFNNVVINDTESIVDAGLVNGDDEDKVEDDCQEVVDFLEATKDPKYVWKLPNTEKIVYLITIIGQLG